MMRRPAAPPLPATIDPWAIARQRRILSGTYPPEQTKELRRWTEDLGGIDVYLEGYNDEHRRPHLKGRIKATLTLTCQRCLESMSWQADLPFDYLLVRSEYEESQIDDGSEPLICATDDLDLAWFAEEEVLLAMPLIAKHEQCRLPIASAPVEEDEARKNPFAQLKNLINNKE